MAITRRGRVVNLSLHQLNIFGKSGEGIYINPSKIIWLWKFFAIQIKFNGSPEIGEVVFRRDARVEA